MNVGDNIRTRRLALGMTQADVARAVHVDQSLICQFERGSKVPTLPLALELAGALQCELEDLAK